MFLNYYRIDKSSFIADIVAHDYRTAEVFRKYKIEYCCGGKLPLDEVCAIKDIDVDVIKGELEQSMRRIEVSNSLRFDEWQVDFLADYIVNVHHNYLKTAMPEIKKLLRNFVESHANKYPYLPELEYSFLQLNAEVFPHMSQEEEILFPYIKQIYHAHSSRESYASLLVRTLRKPVEEVMVKEHESAIKHLHKMRAATHDYTPPKTACVNHRVIYYRLKELDNDLTQHIYLENNILFPKAIAIEKELLKTKG